MGTFSIRQLSKKASSKQLKKFAKYYGFKKGGTSGDDVIYYHPTKKYRGAEAYIKITLNKKEGIPMDTLKTIMNTSGLSKSDWELLIRL